MSVGTITTEAELAALPERTAVVDHMGDVGTVLGGMLRYPETTPQTFERAAKKYGPFHIVYSPPAPEPEPAWDRAADYVATVRGVPGVRVTWSPVDESDRAPWRTRESVGDGKWSWHEEQYVSDVRPLVVIDPAEVDVDALAKTWTETLAGGSNLTISPLGALWHEALRAVLAELGIEVSR